MATETLEQPVATEGGVPPSVADIIRMKEEAEERTRQQALAKYKGLTAERNEVRGRVQNRQTYCEQRGVDLDRVVDFVKEHYTPPAATVDTSTLSKEEQFVLNFAQEHSAGGFTMEEMPNAAKKAGFKIESKDDRQPLYQAVAKFEAAGLFKKADFKRDEKVVFVLARPINQTGSKPAGS
jgi:hypothetical protein